MYVRGDILFIFLRAGAHIDREQYAEDTTINAWTDLWVHQVTIYIHSTVWYSTVCVCVRAMQKFHIYSGEFQDFHCGYPLYCVLATKMQNAKYLIFLQWTLPVGVTFHGFVAVVSVGMNEFLLIKLL